MSKVCRDASTALELSGLKSGHTVAVGKHVNVENDEVLASASLEPNITVFFKIAVKTSGNISISFFISWQVALDLVGFLRRS